MNGTTHNLSAKNLVQFLYSMLFILYRDLCQRGRYVSSIKRPKGRVSETQGKVSSFYINRHTIHLTSLDILGLKCIEGYKAWYSNH